MIYIDPKPNASGAYPNPKNQYFPNSISLDKEDEALFFQYSGFITIDEEGVVSPNTEKWEEWKASLPDTLEEEKDELIQKSKEDLAIYLETHPLQWIDGNYYSITQEKQNQLTSKIMAATMAQTLSQEYNLTWNSTGEVCQTWTLQDLSALAFAIDARVTKLVSYQQEKEVEIRNTQNKEELEAIIIDYDSVK